MPTKMDDEKWKSFQAGFREKTGATATPAPTAPPVAKKDDEEESTLGKAARMLFGVDKEEKKSKDKTKSAKSAWGWKDSEDNRKNKKGWGN